jgi:CDP-diacylglycerol--serine O-phosphatidyltransferase
MVIKNKSLFGFFKNLPNFITTLNLISGWLGIIYLFNGKVEYAVICIYFGAVFDFLDGLVARLFSVKSEFGKNLDSLCDIVTFGVLPSFIMYKLMFFASGGNFFLALPSVLIGIAALLRLARFNSSVSLPYFIGMPVPLSALFISTLPTVYSMQPSDKIVELIVICLILSIFSVSNIRFFALKFKTYNLRENYLKYLLIIMSAIMIGKFSALGLLFVLFLYITIVIVNNLFRIF